MISGSSAFGHFDELTAQRQSEFSHLLLQYSNGLLDGGKLNILEENRHFTFLVCPLLLDVEVALTYPAYPPKLALSLQDPDDAQLQISRIKLFELETRLKEIVHERRSEPVLLPLLQEFISFVQEHEATLQESEETEGGDKEELWSIDECIRFQKLGAIATLDSRTAQSFMGQVTIESIVQKLPSNVRLLHAEVVLRPHLVRRFKAKQEALIQKHASQFRGSSNRRLRDAAADKLGQIEVVFHGSLRRHIGSIVQNGFIIPGKKTVDGEEVTVRCGSTWGMGTYTTPEPAYSLSYTDTTAKSYRLLPGEKIVVCAALMGKRYQMASGEFRREIDSVQAGYDSHVSPSKLEYVIFDPAQLLPLYVLHLEDAGRSRHAWNAPAAPVPGSTGASSSNIIDRIPAGASLALRRKILTAQARSRLPFGFGAATGSNFVVEEIAPVDDDEEMWGEYHEDAIKQLGYVEELDEMGEFQSMRIV